MNKPVTRTPYRHSGVTVGKTHPDIGAEPETDDTEMPEGFYDDGEPETERESFWREWNRQPGE